MRNKLKYLLTSAIAISTLGGANTAFAAGTTAGTDVTNTVTVTFEVGNIAQTPPPPAFVTFTVDRVIRFIIAEVGGTATSVTPGQDDAATTFTLTNTSNAVLDFDIVAAQATGGAAAFTGNDNFDVTSLRIFEDTDGNGVFDLSIDQVATTLNDVAEDAIRTFFLVGNIPGTQVNGDIATVIATGTARAADGSPLSDDSANLDDPNLVQNVFDLVGTTDSDRDDFLVASADLTTTPPLKYSRVISDPVNGTTNPKAIPGAVVEYCITVTNDPGASVAAQNIVLTDNIGALPVTYVANSAFVDGVGGPDVNGVCTPGATSGTFTDPVVSGTIPTLPVGETHNLVFQVTID